MSYGYLFTWFRRHTPIPELFSICPSIKNMRTIPTWKLSGIREKITLSPTRVRTRDLLITSPPPTPLGCYKGTSYPLSTFATHTTFTNRLNIRQPPLRVLHNGAVFTESREARAKRGEMKCLQSSNRKTRKKSLPLSWVLPHDLSITIYVIFKAVSPLHLA